MKIKRFVFLLAVLASIAYATVANGQIVALRAQPVTFASDSNQAELVVSMDFDTQETIVSWSFDLYLPDGIAPIYDEDEEEWLGEMSTETNTKRMAKGGLNIKKKTDGGYIVLGFDSNGNQAMTSTHGLLCKIVLGRSSNLSGTGIIKNISMGNNKNESVNRDNFADVIFDIDGGGTIIVPDPVQPDTTVVNPPTDGKIAALSATPIQFKEGATQAELVVSMDFDTEETIVSWSFNLYLPDGFAPVYDEDEEEWLGEMSTETNTKRMAKGGLNISKRTDGGYLVLGFDTKGNQAMTSTHGKLCTIVISGSSNISGTGLITDISMANISSNSVNKDNFADVYFDINGGGETPTPGPEFVVPANLVVTNTYLLDWLNKTDESYKPTVSVTTDGSSYGRLTVVGESTLSMQQFNMTYNPAYGRQAFASLINNATMRADNVSVDLKLLANRWEFVSFPFDVKVGDLRLSNEELPYAIRAYDGQKRADGLTNETWADMTAESTLEAGKGYIIRIPAIFGNYANFGIDALQTVNKNNIFANDDVEVSLASYESEFAHNRSWNLIGNPYPCFYDIRAMQTSAPVIVWNAASQTYDAYTPADDAYILTPGQAFFVQRPVDEQSITFLKSGRQNNLIVRNISFVQASRAGMLNVNRSVFNLALTANGQGDRTRFVINDNASLDYETARDAAKFQSLEPTAVQLYTLENGVRYSINERPLSNGVISLGMQIPENGHYTIALDTKADQEVILVDHITGQQVRLDGNADGYAFTSEAGTYESRFSVILGGGEATGISEIASGSVNTNTVYDLQGRRVDNAQKGVYLINGKKTVVK